MADNVVKPLTLGEAVERLGLGEGIIAEFPNGKHRYLTRDSRLDKIDAALPLDRFYKHDWSSKTYHVKISTLEMYLSPKQFKLEPGPITLCGICKDLTPSDKMIVEFPNGLTKTYYFYSDLRHLDDEQFLVLSCEYDCPSKTYHVKVEKKYKPGLCEYQEDKIEIKPRNPFYGIDPIAHTKEYDEYNPISQKKNIREYYELLYDKYFKIKRIICDGPATIIFWNDGTKTVVKAQEEVDIEKGILYAALKKLATKKEYDNILRAIDKVDEARKNDPVAEKKETPKKKREPKYQKCPVCGGGYNLNWPRMDKLNRQKFVDIRCSKCDTLFRVKGNPYTTKWWTKLEHDVLIKGGDK